MKDGKCCHFIERNPKMSKELLDELYHSLQKGCGLLGVTALGGVFQP